MSEKEGPEVDEMENKPQRQRRREAYNFRGIRVLVVEDYGFMGDLVCSMLKEFGVGHILSARSGHEAREMVLLFNGGGGIGRHGIDILVMDWLMPKGDGPELLKWIRNHRSDSVRFVPAILCSAYASADLVKTARDFGANEALVKPLSAQKLAKRILHVVDYPRPFIKTRDFFGPDRRRREDTFKGDDRRKIKADQIRAFHEEM